MEKRFYSPNKSNPAQISAKDMLVGPDGTDHIFYVFLEWDEGSYGTKVPIVVVRSYPIDDIFPSE